MLLNIETLESLIENAINNERNAYIELISFVNKQFEEGNRSPLIIAVYNYENGLCLNNELFNPIRFKEYISQFI